MRKILFLALFLLSFTFVKSQTLSGPTPAMYFEGNSFLSNPAQMTYDSATGMLNYSLTINYPSGAQRDSLVSNEANGIQFYVWLYNGGDYSELVGVNTETATIANLPSGAVTYSGSIHIANLLTESTTIETYYSSSFEFLNSRYVSNSGYDVWEFNY